jgi:hypothetical protein
MANVQSPKACLLLVHGESFQFPQCCSIIWPLLLKARLGRLGSPGRTDYGLVLFYIMYIFILHNQSFAESLPFTNTPEA